MRRDQLSGQGGFVRSNTQLNLSSPPLFLTFYHPLTVEEEGRLRRGAETYTFKLSLTVYVFLFALYVRSYLVYTSMLQVLASITTHLEELTYFSLHNKHHTPCHGKLVYPPRAPNYDYRVELISCAGAKTVSDNLHRMVLTVHDKPFLRWRTM